MLNKNKSDLWYGIYRGEEDLYGLDDNNEVIIMHMPWGDVPLVIGKKPAGYEVHAFRGSISYSGGTADSEPYGIDTSDYSAKIVAAKGELPIVETSLIWTKQPEINEYGRADGSTADYRCIGVYPSLTQVEYLFEKTIETKEAGNDEELNQNV